MSPLTFKGPLHEMVSTTRTVLWNDSCSAAELRYALEHGAVGATSNPVIVGEVLKREMPAWKDRIGRMVTAQPHATEEELAWKVIEEMSLEAAKVLEPVFAREQGKNGRLSIQTDPRLYQNADAMVRQAVRLAALAPNIIVKIPATKAGVEAMEDVTAQGISINATVCFTVSQCLAVAAAVERGLARREQAGQKSAGMGSVCTIMVGRLDDWLKVIAEKEHVVTDPAHLEWAGVAVMKKTYRLFKERGYRLRLLAAAFRNHMHWSEFIGGDVVISPPHLWQRRFNASDIKVANRMDRPVQAAVVTELSTKFAAFRAAYEEGGLSPAQFDTYGPTVRTLRQFIGAFAGLTAVMRDFMLPNPDAS